MCIRCINYVCSHVHVARNGVNSKNVAIMPERGMRVPLPFQLDDIYIYIYIERVNIGGIVVNNFGEDGRDEGSGEKNGEFSNDLHGCRCAPLVAFFNGMCARILHGPRVSVLKVTASTRFNESRYSFGRPRFSTPSFSP